MATHPVSFTMLDASTAHLAPKTRQQLESNSIEGVLFYDKGPWGWFVHVPSPELGPDLDSRAPDDIKTCLAFAQSQGYQWIMFDADGSIVDALPIYEEAEGQDAQLPKPNVKLANAYALHLSNSLGRTFTGECTGDGKIIVKEASGTVYGKVSTAFAMSMVLIGLPVVDQPNPDLAT